VIGDVGVPTVEAMKQMLLAIPLMLLTMLVIGVVVALVAAFGATIDLIAATTADLRWVLQRRREAGQPRPVARLA
jgi:hypothetical protein